MNILIISDGLHGKNKLYYKTKDNIYYVHQNILDEIKEIYQDKDNFYIYGEPIDKNYTITYKDKTFEVSGEEVNINSIWLKLLNGFSNIIFGCNPFIPNSCGSSQIILNRIKEILDSVSESNKSNDIYVKYMQLFELINTNLSNTLLLHKEFIDFLKNNKGKVAEITEKYNQIDESIKKNNILSVELKFSMYADICGILKNIIENEEILKHLDMIISDINEKTLYDITLFIRDINIVSNILQSKKENIIIIIGGNHIQNITNLLKKQLGDDLSISIMKKNEKLIEDIEIITELPQGIEMQKGGNYYNKYVKYKSKYIKLKKMLDI